MSERADSKKQHIIKAAREVFALKGFKDVTMKDIVEKAQISRGGLYLYYDSTEAVFRDVLAMEGELEDENDNDGLVTSISDASAGDILMWFLREQKKEILRSRKSLSVAVYEYAFYCRDKKINSITKTRFEAEVLALEKILIQGVRNGEFICDDPKALAIDMMYTIEGMKICSRTMGISEKKIDSELKIMLSRFVGVEE